MPFLNAREFIAEAIESVRRQTYPRWELWLVNDGSSDGSAAVAHEIAASEPTRIRVLTHPDGANHGMSASRNLGISRAGGEFVAFLDADDVWLPESLAAQVPRLQSAPDVGALYSHTQHWHSWAGPQANEKDNVPRLRVETGRAIAGPALLARCIQGRAAVPCTCSILVRRDAVRLVGGFETQFPRLYEDQAFYAKLFAATPVLPIDGWWARYRRHPGSSTMSAEGVSRVREWRYRYLTWLEEYLRRDPASYAVVAPALRRELWRCRHPRIDRVLDRITFTVRKIQRDWRP